MSFDNDDDDWLNEWQFDQQGYVEEMQLKVRPKHPSSSTWLVEIG